MKWAWLLVFGLSLLGVACDGEDEDEEGGAFDIAPTVGGDDPEGDSPTRDEDDVEGEQIVIALLDDESRVEPVGRATLRPEDNRSTTVTITIEGAQPPGIEAQPAYVGEGTCGARRSIAYELTDVINNQSATTIPVGLEQLLSGQYFITVQFNDGEQVDQVVGCGAIARG